MTGSETTAQMTLFFVAPENLLHTVIQCAVLLFQALCQILVDCGLADPELFCGTADGCACFCDIFAQRDGSLPDSLSYKRTSPQGNGSLTVKSTCNF